MKCKIFFWFRLAFGILFAAISNGQTGGLGLAVQQIETIGPRQWLNLMVGSMLTNTPGIGPVAKRLANISSSRPPSPISGFLAASRCT